MERLSFGHGFVPRIGRDNHRALDRALSPPGLLGDEPSEIPWVIVDGAKPDTPLSAGRSWQTGIAKPLVEHLANDLTDKRIPVNAA